MKKYAILLFLRYNKEVHSLIKKTVGIAYFIMTFLYWDVIHVIGKRLRKMKNHKEVWDDCLLTIKGEVDVQSFKTWFEPIKSISLEKEVLTIQLPNNFFFERIEENYIGVLRKALITHIGKTARLEYKILVDNYRKIGTANEGKKQVEIPKPISGDQIKNPFVIPGIKKVRVDSQLNDIYTLDNYIVGSNNELGAKAGREIAKRPGGTAFNPLVIYGDVGLGKTHLAQAIGNEVMSIHPDKQVLYVTTERFTSQVVHAIKTSAVNDFMNFHQMIDVFIVDDVHFLADRPKTQEVFFNIFNYLHQNGKQIILTMDRAPKDLVQMDERLISRFKWGLAAELTVPDFDARMRILKSKMQKDSIVIDEAIQEYICYNIKNNIRELEGALITIAAQATLNNKEINMDLAKVVVNQFVKDGSKEITVENIKKLVAEYFSVPLEKLQGKTRKRDVVVARQLSMYFAKLFTDNTYKVIGNQFGGRDHSTVIYSINAVQDQIDTDTDFKTIVDELERKVHRSLY